LLLDGLAAALELQRQLVPEDFGLQLLRQQAGEYAHSLQKTAKTMGLLAAAFERGLSGLTSAGIGISLEEAPAASGLRITGVAAEMPAGRAGVTEGDLLMAINGAATAGTDLEKASARLRGPAGSTVAITLLRDGHRRELELTRALLAHVEPPARRPASTIHPALWTVNATVPRLGGYRTGFCGQLLLKGGGQLAKGGHDFGQILPLDALRIVASRVNATVQCE
jgi:hypothetical protein